MRKKLNSFFIIVMLLFICLFQACKAQTQQKNDYTLQVYPMTREGINIHLNCMNSNKVKAEDNILLVHGLTYSSHEFDVDYEDYSLTRFLCDNGYAVWRLDISGYGQSDPVEDGFMVDSNYASKDVSAVISEILEITGAENIDLLGWSWGTVTGTLAERIQANNIDKYIMYAPIITGLGQSEVAVPFHENTWENAAEDFQKNPDGSFDTNITECCIIDTYCSNCWKYDKASSPNGGRRDLCTNSSVELINLSAIKSPTLIICGDKDPYIDMDAVNNAKEKLPDNSSIVVIEGGAHCLMIEKPYYHKFQQSVIQFLKNS